MKKHSILQKAIHYLNLEPELDDFKKIHESIVKDSIFKGTNLWILVFAIIVASIGLNMNSTAVIIGAMLISPLMGPINAIGYSIATYNFELFRQALRNFSFAVFISLVASTFYFLLSPVSTAHSELLARTTPTIYDVLIALFGGLAGIVAISSKLKGNVIPGVAIATALMPPLCTAGYGLATAQFSFFFGAFYLFTINTVFMALASVIVSQTLKFPITSIVDPSQKKRVNRWISTVIVLVLLPSIYFGYGLVKKEQFSENAKKYILTVNVFEGNYLLKSEVNPDKKTILLTYGGFNLSDEQKHQIISKAEAFDLKDSKVEINQGFSFSNFDNNPEVIMLRDEISKLNRVLQKKDSIINAVRVDNALGKTILHEVRTIYPEIESCTYAFSNEYSKQDSVAKKSAIVLFTVQQDSSNVDKVKVSNWVKTRLGINNVRVIYQ
jgi:uncharacterized hydrophobic protein (TIGR00271 family)